MELLNLRYGRPLTTKELKIEAILLALYPSNCCFQLFSVSAYTQNTLTTY